MDERIPSPEFLNRMASAASAPDPSEIFFNDLLSRLKTRAAARQKTGRIIRRIAWGLSLAAFLVLAACVLIVGPANVATAIRDALGYIPGFGVVHTTGLRVLAEPVVASRDGKTISINSIIADSSQTWISYRVSGVELPPMNPAVSTPDPRSCTASPFLRFPDGKEVPSIGGGGMQTETYYEANDQFPPLPEGLVDATLVFPCLSGTLPGTAPENWEVPFHLVLNPAAPSVVPVRRIDTPSPETGRTPTENPAANLFQKQITLTVDRMAEVEDGFIIMGSVQTTSDQYLIDPFFPTGAIAITDSTGAEIPAEVASVGNDNPGLQDNQGIPSTWAYKVQGKNFHGPLTLTLKWVTISPNDSVTFPVDVGKNPQSGQTWILDRQVDLCGYLATVRSAKYVVGNDMGPEAMQGLEFTVDLPDAIAGLQLNYWDPNPQPGAGGSWAPLGDGFKHDDDSLMVGFLTSIPLTGIVNITANVIYANGPWTATWNIPPG